MLYKLSLLKYKEQSDLLKNIVIWSFHIILINLIIICMVVKLSARGNHPSLTINIFYWITLKKEIKIQ